MIDMATKQIIPAVIKYTTVLGESINTVKTAGEGLIDVSVQLDLLLKKASKLLKAANSAMSKLSKLVRRPRNMQRDGTEPYSAEKRWFLQWKLYVSRWMNWK